MGDQEQWYTNKELFEMINGLKSDLTETRKVVKEYNDLRSSLNDCIRRVTNIEQRGLGKQSVEAAVLRWGGWAVALISLGYVIFRRG